MSTPRKIPRQQRSEFTFEAILDAAARLFQRHGYAKTTTNKVAELAGVSIGTLYHYLPNKDALLFALTERHLQHGTQILMTEAAALRADQPPPTETIRRLITAVVDLHTDQPRLHRLLFDQAPRTAQVSARLSQLERQLADEMEFHLHRLGIGGPDPALTALLLIQGIETHVHRAVLRPHPDHTTEQCLAAVIDLWTRALT
jgi:AcrR family transcriptional regulator